MYSGFSKDIEFAEKEITGADLNNKAISLLAQSIGQTTTSNTFKEDSNQLIIKKQQYQELLRL